MVFLQVSVRSFRDGMGDNRTRLPFTGLAIARSNMDEPPARSARAAIAFDQESIATRVLSGRYLGFLPDHYAEAFERTGRLQAVRPEAFFYQCQFVSLVRRSPAPTRAAQAFVWCLSPAHQRAVQTS